MTEPESQTLDPNWPQIPGFKILGLAGQGGMGAVYRAEQLTPRRVVALKVLRQAGSAEDLADFRKEAQTIASLEHPHIVPLYAFGESSGAPYLALRFLDGGTAAQRLVAGPIEPGAAEPWITAIADALDFAHQRGLVHRDVKPSNILLDQANNAYLSDFGIAGATSSATFGPPTGSAAYMPPEQGRGEAVDGRGDLYALAVTLFEMLTGRKPYTAETAFGVIVRHLNDPIPSAADFNPRVPTAVSELLKWTMAKAPADRPQSARDFSRLLKSAFAHPTVPIRPRAAPGASPGGQTMIAGQTIAAAPPRPGAGSLWWIAAVIVLALACLGVVVITAGGGALALLAAPSATPPATATTLPTRPPTAATGASPTATLDPDGGVIELADGIEIIVRRNQVEWFWPLSATDVQDSVLAADVTQQTGPDKNEMALVCRWQDNDNAVVFAISGEGEYRVVRTLAGQATELVPWTPSASIRAGAGATNSLRATCSGSSLTFEINGDKVAEAIDPSPTSGRIGVLAGLREEGQLTVKIDQIVK